MSAPGPVGGGGPDEPQGAVSDRPGNPNNRVRAAVLQRDVDHILGDLGNLTAAVDGVRAEQKRGLENQAREMGALKDHFDTQFDTLRQAVTDLARGGAVFEACARQWQIDHERRHAEHDERHKQEHEAETRKSWIGDVVAGVAAALAGIYLGPGGRP